MKYCITIFLIVYLCAATAPGIAQTLTEKLTNEDPKILSRQARQKGDVVRGAILFHQGSTNCAKCHRANSEQQRIGPDLAKLAEDVTDEQIIESILHPSKQIRKGFETVVVLTLDGRITTGTVVNDGPNKLVIRSTLNVDQLITIDRADIDEIQAGKNSSMPDKLADELKNRQQFFDLLRYVIDIKERGPIANAHSVQAKRTLAPEHQGLVYVQQLNCAACHRIEQLSAVLKPKQAPRLKWSARWLNPDFLKAMIVDPHSAKPGSTMPDMLHQLSDDEKHRAAKAITQFLIENNQNEYTVPTIDKAAASKGKSLFHSIGCVACHSPRNELSVEQTIPDSRPLGDISGKYSLKGLVEFLENPMLVRPSGHMPNMRLSRREATELANYLLITKKSIKVNFDSDAKLADQGATLFAKYNCVACHADQLKDSNTLSIASPLNKLDATRGCMADAAVNVPAYQLDDHQKQSIQALLANFPSELNKQQLIDIKLAALNCIACHDRNHLGGVSMDRNPHFQTTNLNLGDQGRIPPTLTGVGAKLKRKWMRDVMVNAKSIRPYMTTRMPQFGESNIVDLIDLFETVDQTATFDHVEIKDQKAMRKTGLELVGNKGLNCIACHTYKFKTSDTMPAVDLTEMAARLKKDWFHRYMLTPQKFSPNTVMPSFWPNGKAIRKDLTGTPEEQVGAIWQYLLDGRQAGQPRGVVHEPLEIVVTNEARMLRRQYPGIGKRGIGVGYPGGINIAYDAEQLRLAMIWQGKFVDPGGVWRGQGSGNVRPMGRPVNLAKGPDLDFARTPWKVDDGRPPNHQFKGYVLDDQRRPTFKYEVGANQVTDYFVEIKNHNGETIGLRRELKTSSAKEPEEFRFRIASGKNVIAESNKFIIDKRLVVRMVSDHDVQKSELGDQHTLEILVTLKPNTQSKIIIEYKFK